MNKNQNQAGSAHIVIIVILVLAIVGGLGFVAYTKFFAPKVAGPVSQTTTQTDAATCGYEGDAVEEDGVFCSDVVGIKLAVPTILQAKLEKIDNYEVFKSGLDFEKTKESVGTSDVVYETKMTGEYGFKLTIAKEPVRSGTIESVYHENRNTYYDEETGLLSLLNYPIANYDSTTDTVTTSGEFSVGETVPSFKVGDVTFFKGSFGDAGLSARVYFAVINGSFVKIELRHLDYIGGDPSPYVNQPTTEEGNKIFSDFETSVKNIEFLN